MSVVQSLRTLTRPIGFEKLQAEIRKYKYLAEYINKVVKLLGSLPEYFEGKIPDEYKKKANVNVMYPLGNGIFVHIFMPPGGTKTGYRKYVVVEPPLPNRVLVELVELKMAEHITEKDIPKDVKEKKQVLLRLLEKVSQQVNHKVDYSRINPLKVKRIPVNRIEYECLKYHMIKDKVGLGILEPFVRDSLLEDISCDGVGPIHIVHKIFGPLETSIEFKTEEELDKFIIELSERIGKPVSHARPIVDATLPDGSRINIVFGTDVSLKGSNFTIRRFSKVPPPIIQLIKWGTVDARVAAYYWILILEGMSGFIAGETASGKTTFLNAIIAFIKPTAKIVTIEDTAEVQVPHSNWVRELTRDTGSAESSITMFDLLKAALRQRPNYIIVGEIRGAEGNTAFQAMQSVSGDTPILVRNTKTNEVTLLHIAEFVDKFYNKDEEGQPKTVKDYEVLSLDRHGKVIWAPIRYVLRHKANEIYEIEYEKGGLVKATGSHSIFVLDENTLEIKPKYVTDLHKGDLLISFVAKSRKMVKLNNAFKGIKLLIENDIKAHTTYTFRNSLTTANMIWRARLAGFHALVKKMNKRGRTYFSVSLKSQNKELKRIPIKPIVNIIERAKLLTKIPRKLYCVINEFRKTKQRLIPTSVALELLEFINNNYKSLTTEDKALLDKLKILMNSDIVFLEVIDVRKVSYDGFVYDVSVPGTELFLGGVIPIALHNTGHPVLATFHAGSVERLIQRITSPPISVPKTQLDNLNFVSIHSAVYREGVMMRRALSVNEIMGYDAAKDTIIYLPVFIWDPSRDVFLFRGRGASYLLEEKIGVKRGIPRRSMRLIYQELDLRARILELLKERNIVDYHKVFEVIVHVYHKTEEKARGRGKEETQQAVLEGLEEAIRDIERGKVP